MSRRPGRLEQWSFALGAFGQNLVYGISVSFVTYAFTDLLGITPAAVGLLFFVTRTFDALNDPLMGILADRTKTRWGRFRPWLLWTPIPIAVLTTLTFVRPELSMAGRVAYAATVYVLWSITYTLCDIPLWALSSAMTSDSAVRTSIITRARAMSMVGLALPTLAVPRIAQWASPADPAMGYPVAVAILVALAVPLMALPFFSTRERVSVASDHTSVRSILRLLAANRPLQIIVVAGLFNSLTFVAQATLVYFVNNNLRDPQLLPIFGGVGVVAITIGVAATPPVAARIGKRNTIVATGIIRSVLAAALYVAGYQDLVIAATLFALVYLLLGPWIVLQTSMIADAVDYGELVSGVRAAGLTFSFQTLLAKANAAIGGLVGATLLGRIGYQPGVLQAPGTLSGIFAMMTLLPAAGSLLSAIPFLWYRLGETEHRRIAGRLRRRRERRALVRRDSRG